MKLRRNYLLLCVMTLLAGAIIFASHSASIRNVSAAAKEIKVGVLYPLSGATARNGNLEVQGIKAAMGWVNDNGGIKSLGGAKLVPVIADTGTTVEGVANATERVVRDPDILMVMGSWASSYTMASTAVTERLGIPQFADGFADALTERGFKYSFYAAPPTSAQADMGLGTVLELARSKGQVIKTVMFLGDNSAGSKAFYEACRKRLPSMGVKIVGEETWPMGSLTDATPAMQKVKTINPDVVVFEAIAAAECQMILMKKKEFGIKIPFITNGAYIADPTLLPLGAEVLEGTLTICPYFVNKLTPEDWIKRTLDQCAKEYSKEPYVNEMLGQPWTMVPVMAEVLGRAASRDRKVIRDTASKLDIQNVMATRFFPKQGIAYDDNGRIAKKYQEVLLVQWQGGIPKTVYPPNLALAEPIWVGK